MKKRYIFIAAFTAVLIFLLAFKVISINSLFQAAYPIKGVDVSHYQGDIDWHAISNQDITFAYIKATEGSSYVDEMYQANRDGVEQTDILYGFYHFFSFESGGVKQAEHYIKTVGKLKGCLVPTVDVEYYGDLRPDKDNVIEQLKVCLDVLEKEYGQKPVIYSTTPFYNKYLKNEFEQYPLWIRNVYFFSFKNWTFWQYSDRKVLAGYSGKEKYIDINAFCGDDIALNKYVLN